MSTLEKSNYRNMAALGAAIKETAKIACAHYRLVSLTLFMNQVQINQCFVAAHRYIGIVFYQAGKRATVSRSDIGTQEFHIRTAFCTEEVGIAKRCIDG